MSRVRHLSLIPDGNRRWAQAQGQDAAVGHRAGIENVGRIVGAAWDAGVEVVSFWWGSPANLCQRDPVEVAGIVDALGDWLSGPGAALLAGHGATFEAIGRWEALAPGLSGPVATARAAAGAGPRRLVLLMAYDGREEILAAAQALPDLTAATTDALGAALWTGHLPPVDLVLRTGGEPHLSAGYLLWHIAEAQLHFSDRLWPDYDAQALTRALAACAQVERRFGR